MDGIDFAALQGCFAAEELEWRVQQAGEKNGRVWAICVPYVTSRAIQQRLDEAARPENWRNEFARGPEGGVLCGISLRIDGEWVTKWDGAENTDIEGVKGGLSGAMKRAAVQWGIGRYLYGLDETFAQVHPGGRLRGRTRQGTDFRWDPPRLPGWALPAAPSGGAASSAEHGAVVEFVRRVGPRVGDDAQIRVARRVRNLKEFMRENWSSIQDQPSIARAVADAIATATGERPGEPAAHAA